MASVRTVPPAAPKTFEKSPAREGIEFAIDLLTPIFGGGTRSYHPDRSMPVRSQAVKGQLRFWWRTMQTATSAQELREKEDLLWGSVECPSAVSLAIRNEPSPQTENYVQSEAERKYPPYVLFPLPYVEGGPPQIITSHRFVLHLRIPGDMAAADRQAIERAVKLWTLFGGVGSRTRRGCGSLYCDEVMQRLATEKGILNFLKTAAGMEAKAAYGTSPWPRLNGGALFLKRSRERDPVAAWKAFLDRYAGFRQGRGIGRSHGKGQRPGRTFWPEADALRRITGVYGRHPPEHLAGNWFPRGAYGMPIEFEFRNDPTDPSGKFFLQPSGHERWPSPVILKIVKLADGTLLEACLILNAALPGILAVKDQAHEIHSLTENEGPLAYSGKEMPAAAPLHPAEHPYAALARHLGPWEVQS